MDVKVCNLRGKDFEDSFIHSIMNTGFAVITHHGIDERIIRESQAGWREFFLSPKDYKEFFINEEDSNMGYKGFKSETAVGFEKPDLKEFFHYKLGANIPDELFVITRKLFMQLEDVGLQLLSTIDESNHNMTTYADDCANSQTTLLRSLYYPAMDFSAEKDAVRAAAHGDINHITLLVAASAPGLQVKDLSGKWHDVPYEENSLTMNVGDMLQLASQGMYKSTTHRVINPPDNNSDRISMPLFIHPKPETILAPGYTAKQFLDDRIAEIYGKK